MFKTKLPFIASTAAIVGIPTVFLFASHSVATDPDGNFINNNLEPIGLILAVAALVFTVAMVQLFKRVRPMGVPKRAAIALLASAASAMVIYHGLLAAAGSEIPGAAGWSVAALVALAAVVFVTKVAVEKDARASLALLSAGALVIATAPVDAMLSNRLVEKSNDLWAKKQVQLIQQFDGDIYTIGYPDLPLVFENPNDALAADHTDLGFVRTIVDEELDCTPGVSTYKELRKASGEPAPVFLDKTKDGISTTKMVCTQLNDEVFLKAEISGYVFTPAQENGAPSDTRLLVSMPGPHDALVRVDIEVTDLVGLDKDTLLKIASQVSVVDPDDVSVYTYLY